MAGLNGLTVSYRLSTNVRVAKFSALIDDTTDSTQTRWYASVPPSATPWLTPCVGVTIEHYLEPNPFYPEDTDPTTITGTTPSGQYVLGGTGISLDRAITVATNGAVRQRVYAAGAVTAGQVVYIADQYGRVNNRANLAITAGTSVYPVGIARSTTSAANQILFVDIMLAPVAAI